MANKTLGVTKFFYGFLSHLNSERKRIAPLQISGRLEDYLVHEFISYIHTSSSGARFAFTNIGKANEQKVDIIIASGTREKIAITAMVEAKYLRNRHRFSNNSAEDETKTILRSLRQQLHKFSENVHADWPVQLLSKRQDIYGIVFSSYVDIFGDDEEINIGKERFYDKCLNVASEMGLRYHDLRKPYWRSAFENERVNALKTNWSISLRAGLWRLASPE